VSVDAVASYSLVFYVYDVPNGGTPLANLGIGSVTVSNGLFTEPLDFGNVFHGAPLWLEVGVEKTGPGGDSGFTTLAPRQQILATHYDIMAGSASNLVGNVTLAQLPSIVLTNGNPGVNLSGAFSGSGNGLTNLSAAAATEPPISAILASRPIRENQRVPRPNT
jgi:hypothetical protein